MSPYRVSPRAPAALPPHGLAARLRAILARWRWRRAFVAWQRAAGAVDVAFWRWHVTRSGIDWCAYDAALDAEEHARRAWRAADARPHG